MNVIDLKPDHVEIVSRILAEYIPDYEVRAFGSRVTGTAGEYSDLDLAVVGEVPLELRVISRLNEAFEESSLPMQVDVLDWHSIPARFRQQIEKHYVVVQKQGKQIGWRTILLGEVVQSPNSPRLDVQNPARD